MRRIDAELEKGSSSSPRRSQGKKRHAATVQQFCESPKRTRGGLEGLNATLFFTPLIIQEAGLLAGVAPADFARHPAGYCVSSGSVRDRFLLYEYLLRTMG